MVSCRIYKGYQREDFRIGRKKSLGLPLISAAREKALKLDHLFSLDVVLVRKMLFIWPMTGPVFENIPVLRVSNFKFKFRHLTITLKRLEWNFVVHLIALESAWRFTMLNLINRLREFELRQFRTGLVFDFL